MSNDPDQYYSSNYEGQYSDRSRELRRPTIYTGIPQYSINFLDVVGPRQSSAQPLVTNVSAYTQHEASPGSATHPNRLWSPVEHGRARTFSDVQIGYDDDEDEDDQEEQAQEQDMPGPALTPAEAAMARRKMKRFRLTHNQTRFLMDEFLKQPHPDAAHRDYLSKLIPGLSSRQVQIWFQNRRAKLKRLSTDDRERLEQQRRSIIINEKHNRHAADALAGDDEALSRTSSRTGDISQASAASLFAKVHEQIHAGPSVPPLDGRTVAPNVTSSISSGRRKSHVRRESALVFGWDLSVYVDDSGSEVDADDGSSIDSSEQSMEDNTEDIEHKHHVPTVEVGIPHGSDATWSMPPLPRPSEGAEYQSSPRRASMQSTADNTTAIVAQAPPSRKRPAYTSRPTWPGPGMMSGNQYRTQPSSGHEH